MDMEKQWRGGQTRAQKLRASLATRAPRSWPPEVAAMFLNKAESTVVAAWRSAPPPQQKVPIGFYLAFMAASQAVSIAWVPCCLPACVSWRSCLHGSWAGYERRANACRGQRRGIMTMITMWRSQS